MLTQPILREGCQQTSSPEFCPSNISELLWCLCPKLFFGCCKNILRHKMTNYDKIRQSLSLNNNSWILNGGKCPIRNSADNKISPFRKDYMNDSISMKMKIKYFLRNGMEDNVPYLLNGFPSSLKACRLGSSKPWWKEKCCLRFKNDQVWTTYYVQQ